MSLSHSDASGESCILSSLTIPHSKPERLISFASGTASSDDWSALPDHPHSRDPPRRRSQHPPSLRCSPYPHHDCSSHARVRSNSLGSSRSHHSHSYSDHRKQMHNDRDTTISSRAVMIGRGCCVVFVLTVAGLFGFLTYRCLHMAEFNLASEQYDSLTRNALLKVRSLAETKLVHGTQVMAEHVGWAYPNASEDWPFVWVPSYWDIMEAVLPTSVRSGVNLAPIVLPEQAAAFEDFAYEKFAENFGPNTTMGATSHFGKGIWVKDPLRVNTSDHRYHDTTGIPLYDGSPYNYLAPKLQDGLVHTPYTMMNVHGFELQGKALDAVMNCSRARKDKANEIGATPNRYRSYHRHSEGCETSEGLTCAPHPKQTRCSALSGMLPPKDIQDEHGISGFIATPIYPANDPYELVGYIFGIVYWIEVVIDIFPQETVGIDCVFADPDHQYTYAINRNNTSKLLCEGDCHDTRYDRFRRTTHIVDPDLVSEGSIDYQLTCYPNREFFHAYQTTNPVAASFFAVALILLMAILFFFYDYCVRREFSAKKDLFEAKRKFVRFVSHEVRTPMNSVCMGLSVIHEEFSKAILHETSDGTQTRYQEPQLGREQIEHWLDLANEISSNAHASVEILDDFLNYDKISSGELTLEYTIVSAWKLIEGAVSEFNLPMAKKKIRLHLSLPNTMQLDSTTNNNGVIDSNVLEPFPHRQWVPRENHGLNFDETTYQQNAEDSKHNDDFADVEASGDRNDLCSHSQDLKIICDSVRITQVIRNLVSNAIKFSKGEGDIFISVKFEEAKRKATKTFKLKSKDVISCKKSGDLVFTIKDNGVGMTESQLTNLFQSGVQFDVNNLQAGKGSGLGLYISKGITEQHGGTLSAESNGLGLGTTFSVTLPVFSVPSEVQQSHLELQYDSWNRNTDRSSLPWESTSVTTTETHDGNGGDVDPEDNGPKDAPEGKLSQDDVSCKDHKSLSELKILLIDDSKSNRKLLDRLLTMRGHKCEHAEDGHIGVEMTIHAEELSDPYDIVLMDYEMPTMNGPEAVHNIREYGCDVFVIGVTGNIMVEDVNYFKQCGANLVLRKPFRVKEFEALVQQSLKHDDRGRVVEKMSGELELITLGLIQQQLRDESLNDSKLHRSDPLSSPSLHISGSCENANSIGCSLQTVSSPP